MHTKRIAPSALVGTLTYNVCFTYSVSTLCFLRRLRVPVVSW